MRRHPWLEMIVLIALPLIVVLAGIAMTVLSMEQGFTPIVDAVGQAVPR